MSGFCLFGVLYLFVCVVSVCAFDCCVLGLWVCLVVLCLFVCFGWVVGLSIACVCVCVVCVLFVVLFVV